MIPYGRQNVTKEDIESVVAVLKSDFLVQGPVVERFESSIANVCHAKHGVAVNSATSALHIACLALGVGKGDMVWTSPITFVATSNAALYCGGDIDFVDIDPITFNMCAKKLAEKLEATKISGGKLPKVVIPVHIAGLSCDMEEISDLGKEYGFSIIEDASHCVGASYKGQPVGNCYWSDIAVFSFHPVKIITTSEGGLATTNDDDLARRMQLFRSHGMTKLADEMSEESHGPWYYQQIDLGYNYRMNELQAALGISQLDRLSEIVTERNRLAERYDDLLGNLPILLPKRPKDRVSAFHLYIIHPVLDVCGKCHREIFETLHKRGIGVQLHYIPIHTQPYYQKLGFKRGDFPAAENYYKSAISIPLFPTLGDQRQDEVIKVLKDVVT